jgi:hypothetical protein
MIYAMILFFVLVPGIVFRFPFKKYTTAFVHAILFTTLLYITNQCVEGINGKNDDSVLLTSIYKDAILQNSKDKNLNSSLLARKYN